MAARSKRPSRDTTSDATASGLDAERMSGTRLRASQRRDELLEEMLVLRRSGKIREARGVEKRAAQVEQLLGALETEVKLPNRRNLG
jgi:hypothetical protein